MTVGTKKLLLDVREAGESILQHTTGKSLNEYSADPVGIIRRYSEQQAFTRDYPHIRGTV